MHCGAGVSPLTNGSYRNHCPQCLYSVHVDDVPGDRANTCGGAMRPAGIRRHSRKGWQLEHVCLRCHARSVNRVAPDDTDALIALMSAINP
jgi:hypothetical protein